MEWKVGAQRSLYVDDWVDVRVADVELPNGQHLEHRLLHAKAGAGVVAINPDQQVLLLWRHRFITSTWGWEIPMGGIETGESAIDAAAREFEEETGWRPGPLRPLIYVQPTPGRSTSEHHVYRADEATYIGEAADQWEAERVDWVPLADVRALIGQGKMTSATTIAALLYVLSEPVPSPGDGG